MKILITGNMGYVGPAVARLLRERHPDATIDGFDTGFFRDCLTPEDASPEQYLDHQHFGDIRSIDPGLLRNKDAVIHMAAISNDPMEIGRAHVRTPVTNEHLVRPLQLAKKKRKTIYALTHTTYHKYTPETHLTNTIYISI